MSDHDQVVGGDQTAADGGRHVRGQLLCHGAGEVLVAHQRQSARELDLADVVDVARPLVVVDVVPSRVAGVAGVGQVVGVLRDRKVVQQLQELASFLVVADEDELDEDPGVAEPDDQLLDGAVEGARPPVRAAVGDHGQVVDALRFHRLELAERRDVAASAVAQSHLSRAAAPGKHASTAAGCLGHDEVEDLGGLQRLGRHLGAGHEGGVQVGGSELSGLVGADPSSVVAEVEGGGLVGVGVEEADLGFAVVVNHGDPGQRPIGRRLDGAVVVGVRQRCTGVDPHAALQKAEREVHAGVLAGLVERPQTDPGAPDHGLIATGSLADVTKGKPHDVGTSVYAHRSGERNDTSQCDSWSVAKGSNACQETLLQECKFIDK